MLIQVEAIANQQLFKMIPVEEVVQEAQHEQLQQAEIITSGAGEVILRILPQPVRFGIIQVRVAIPETTTLLSTIAEVRGVPTAGMITAAAEILRAQVGSPTVVEAEAVAHHQAEVLHQAVQEVVITKAFSLKGSVTNKIS